MYLVGLLIAIIVFLLVVALHEAGHMLVAKAFGVGVIEYSIGMGPILFSKRKKDTVYSLRAIPFGGYCAMYGEESMEASGKGDEVSNKKYRRKPDFKTDWREDQMLVSKSWWQRLLIYIAGPFSNIILGIVACLMLVVAFGGASVPEVVELMDDHPAKAVGIQVGDIICGVNDRDTLTWMDYTEYLDTHVSECKDGYVVRVWRDDEVLSFDAIQNPDDGYFGITVRQQPVDLTLENIALFTWDDTRYMFRLVADGFHMLFAGDAHMSDMSSIIGVSDIIATDVTEASEEEGSSVLSIAFFMMALLSINVGLINLLPFPALDGGRTVMCIFEGVFRRKIPTRLEYAVNYVGMVLLLLLLTYTAFNDVVRIITRLASSG